MRRAWRHPCALTTHLHAVPTLSSGTHAWMPKLNSKVWEMAHSQQHGPKNFPSMLQLLGPLELAAAELSAQNPFPSHERDLRNTILRFAVDTYSMTVTQALLLSTELLLTIKGSQRDSTKFHAVKEALPEMVVCCLKLQGKAAALTSKDKMRPLPASVATFLFPLHTKHFWLRQPQLFGLWLSAFPNLLKSLGSFFT